MADIDRFLARVVPWPSAALPGYVGIHWPFKDKHGNSHMPGRALQLHPSAVGFVTGMLRNNVDLYVNMGLQQTSHPPKMKGGRERRAAIRNHENTLAHKAVWLDVDIQHGEYPDTTAALTAFGQWRRKVGLPEPSLIVLTGSGGFHVYWVLDVIIAKLLWETLAYALANAANTEGFKADLKCTIDSVRLMRIPGTFNQKHQPPRQAVIVHDGPDVTLAQLDQALTPYKVQVAPRAQPATPTLNLGKPSAAFAGVPLPGRLDDGIETYVPTIEEVAAECPFIDATLQTGGAGYSEPLWFESLKVAYYVKDGAKKAHDLSDGHATYSEKDTDNKFDEVVRSHASQRIGWPQCRTIHDAGGQECRQCDHLPKNKSPLNFAVPLVKAVVSVATAAAVVIASSTIAVALPQFIPAGFGQHKNGVIYKLVKDPDDPSKPEIPVNILPNPVSDIVAFEKTNGSGKFSVGFKYAVTPTRIRDVVLDYEDFHDIRRLGAALGLQGVSAYPHERKYLGDFLVAFTQQLANAKGRATVLNSAPFGWFMQDGKYQGFVFNRNMYNAQSPVPVQPLSPRIAIDYTPTGDMGVWKKVLGLITDQKRPELLAPICASIGAPLMRMAGMNGAALHLWGDSGSGKSGSLKMSQSVWGSLRWMAQLQDTANSIDVLSSQLSSFPLIYDEVMKGEDRRLVGMYMRLGQGNPKKRSQRDGQDLSGNMQPWFITLISASNSAMHPHLAETDPTTVAPINRVFDLQVERNTSRVGMLETASEAERLFGLLNDNYGLAGLELAKFYGTQYDAVSRLLHAITQGIERRTPCTEHDRFYVTMIGIILAGGIVGNKLGLFNIDMDQMEGFMIERLQDLQGRRKTAPSNLNIAENVERLLAEFIAASRGRTLITDNIWIGAGRSPAGYVKNSNLFDLRGNSVDVRVGINQKIVRVSQPAFHAWLRKERKLSFADVKEQVLALPNVRSSRWDLAQGAAEQSQTARIWALEFTDPSFWDFS